MAAPATSSTATESSFRATLDAWRAQGADRVNRAQFRFIDALERRAAGHDDEVRRVLDARLAALIADYAGEVEQIKAAESDVHVDVGATNVQVVRVTSTTAISTPTSPTPNARRRGALGELADLLASRAAAAIDGETSAWHEASQPHSQSLNGSRDLPMLDYFRATWSKFSTEKQLRHSLEQVPDNAGPLNTNSLVHRSLSLMRELSPGYLQQFLLYVEALSWMEQLAGPVAGPGQAVTAAAPVVEVPPRTGSTKKGTRGKAR